MTLNAESLDTLLESYEDFARRADIPEDVITSILDSKPDNRSKDPKFKNEDCHKYGDLQELDSDSRQRREPEIGVLAATCRSRNDKWACGQVLITSQESSRTPPDNTYTKYIEISQEAGISNTQTR